MSTNFQIIPDRGVVLVRLNGRVLMDDCLSAAEAYARHPAARPTQPLLIDLSSVTAHETDYAKILKAMARLPDYFGRGGSERLVVFIAPSPLARRISAVVVRALLSMPGGVARIAQSESDALEILGLPERRLSELVPSSTQNR
jgi:hypothetical protein